MWLFLLVYGVGALLGGVAAGALFARTARRGVVLVSIGAGAAIAGSLIADSRGAFDSGFECSDCGEKAFFTGLLILGNLVGWTLGVAGGGAGRHLSRGSMQRDELT